MTAPKKILSFILIQLLYATTVAATIPPLEFFKNNYQESDAHFTQLFTQQKRLQKTSEVFQFLYGEGSIKNYYYPSQNTNNLLIVVSGTHGIEGLAGSAVQRYLLDQGLPLENTSVLFVHAFNLWGFKNLRRVNESNIDLNRSFIIDRNHFKPDDSNYKLLNSFLNPNTTPSAGLISHALFIGQALLNIAEYSIETLRASILKGQYTFKDGLFYGGAGPQPQELMIDQLIERYIKNQKKVFLIDLHTGYGERAKLHLLAGRSTEANSVNLKKVFSDDDVDYADKKKFYAVDGEMVTYFSAQILKKIPEAQVMSVTFEYGTLDSQKTLGSIESLRRMVLENQNFHHPASESNLNAIKNLSLEMFYPSDPDWRKSILNQTDVKIKKIYDYLKN